MGGSPRRRSSSQAAAPSLLLAFAMLFCKSLSFREDTSQDWLLQTTCSLICRSLDSGPGSGREVVGRAAAYGGDAQGGVATDLQKHAAFFDRDGDGVVSISETYDAFRALGFGVGVASFGAAFINGALSSRTRPENATSSRLDVYIENIHKGIHGSDTGSYDAEGRFVPEKFDEIFAKHAKTVPDALTSAEIDELLVANRQPGDYNGWVGATSEWKILYSLGKDKDGLLRKDVARGVYDGSLFHQLVQEKASGDK